MPCPKIFDVIVVGAGPSGALAGYHLARSGLQVLIIEKKKIPRYKVCGGGLTRRTLDMLPFDIEHVVETYPKTVKILVADALVFHKTLLDPPLAMVMRDRFDQFLTQQAVAAGALLQENTALKDVSGSQGHVILETSQGRFKTRIVVGADGVGSLVGRALGLRVCSRQMMALEAEVYLKHNDFPQSLMNEAHFDFGVIPRGYGWVFPKSDHFSVGLVSRCRKIKAFKAYLLAYLRAKKLHAQTELRLLAGHRIAYPAANCFNGLSNQKGLLVGDAAGLADPVTGEGILYAVGSAKIAADVILQALNSEYDRLHAYGGRIYEAFGRDLRWARAIAYVLYQFSTASLSLLKSHGQRLGQCHLDIIRGENSYAGAVFSAAELFAKRWLRRA